MKITRIILPAILAALASAVGASDLTSIDQITAACKKVGGQSTSQELDDKDGLRHVLMTCTTTSAGTITTDTYSAPGIVIASIKPFPGDVATSVLCENGGEDMQSIMEFSEQNISVMLCGDKTNPARAMVTSLRKGDQVYIVVKE